MQNDTIMNALFLSRLQFAITIAVHFIFVTLSLGMVWLLFIVETLAWRKKDPNWEKAGRFFGKIFVTTFVFGVVTGLVMEFQFGTNWAAFSDFSGEIFGTPLAAEGMFTFFLESVFIGIYIFGRNKVSRGVHWFSILMVTLGATFSAFWILVANSWMHTPDGYIIQQGKIILNDFSKVVFSKSIWPRFFHTVDGVLIAGAIFMAGVSAYLYLKNKEVELAKKTLKLAIIFGFITSMLELYPFGDMSARQVAATQPTKFASIESVEKTQKGAPLVLFGIPVEKPRHLIKEVRIPYVLSWLAFRDINAEIKGFDQYDSSELPPFTLTFTSFHLMVALGLFFIAINGFGTLLLFKDRIFKKRWFLLILVIIIPLPVIACQLGWITTEVGRQPWIVYGVLKTADAVSANVDIWEVSISIILFSILYFIITAFYIYLIVTDIKRGPQPLKEEPGY
jgi:cytochrome d ubiquinol oxidase subunit I